MTKHINIDDIDEIEAAIVKFLNQKNKYPTNRSMQMVAYAEMLQSIQALLDRKIIEAMEKFGLEKLEATINKQIREAQIKMADDLIDQEAKLYKRYADSKIICTGIKIMADEVREYYEGGSNE